MATTLLPPEIEIELENERSLSDDGITGGGDGPRDPDDDPHNNPEGYWGPSVTPLGAYRVITSWTIVSLVMLFSMLTFVVKERWATSEDWVSVSLPRVLYLNTAILLISSITLEFARAAQREDKTKKCARWLGVTLLLGLAFVCGQIAAWRELVSRGLYLGSNPGSFFIYVISGTHAFHLLGGISALSFVVIFFNRWREKAKQETAVSVIALYWHFMDALWAYLLVLLFLTVQR
jgi:cytochrome c oxidase subunit 3